MFGKRLNAIRKEKGVTAQQMAEMLHVTIRTYRNYESDTTSPSLGTLVQLADILGVTTDYLLCRDPGQGSPDPSDKIR